MLVCSSNTSQSIAVQGMFPEWKLNIGRITLKEFED